MKVARYYEKNSFSEKFCKFFDRTYNPFESVQLDYENVNQSRVQDCAGRWKRKKILQLVQWLKQML